ncbi:zinc finger and BTB domain-containing protein 16 isoform X2 [Haemorhous mexicanus]|uniref:zinc finger and BTB domain-containing protein 16 isoform X2 n=1 Tax=Haemorhous mexicanus TaxID=30427 RepID=UPI0028BD1D8A|nr:zinc finger and BTB domain-containing protein 16 isoform X2 [Haemorhous mexicanus]
MDLTKMGLIQLQNPCHPTGLLHKANQMRLAGTLCDVVIMVDSQEFHAHRTVLACTSKMFEILFHRNSQHYTLDFLSPKTFQQILEYAYTATLQAKVEDLDDLLYAAEILEIEYLEEQCLKILETIQASEDNDTEVTMADGGAAATTEEEEEKKSRYIKGLIISKPTGEEGGYAGMASQSLLAATVEQSPSASASYCSLSSMSPTKAAVDSLMTIGQSLLQGALPPSAPEDSRSATTRRPSGLTEVKTEAMQVDEASSHDSPRTAEPSASSGEKPDEKGKEGPGTPTRSSVITSARELHYTREEGAEPPPEPSQGLPLGPEPCAAAPGEKPLGIYSLLPNHKTEPVLGVPPTAASALHVQPALAVSMDFSAYGGLLPQGFIQRELFSKLGELAVGMKTESRALGEQCSVCGAELPDNETLEQHRKLHSGMKTYGCELCGKRFLDSLRLRMHLLAHSGLTDFVSCRAAAVAKPPRLPRSRLPAPSRPDLVFRTAPRRISVCKTKCFDGGRLQECLEAVWSFMGCAVRAVLARRAGLPGMGSVIFSLWRGCCWKEWHWQGQQERGLRKNLTVWDPKSIIIINNFNYYF